MQQLIEEITSQYGVTQEQATNIINTVTDYQNNNSEQEDAVSSSNNTTATEQNNETTNNTLQQVAVDKGQTAQAPAEENFIDKAKHFVEDHLPGGMKEKAEELMSSVGNKIKGMFD